MNRLIVAILLLAFPLVAGAKDKGSSSEELFSLANLALLDGRYEEAIEGYIKIEKNGIANPDIYYNLGNAYAKFGENGKALLYYEKSLKLNSEGDDAKHNISVVKERMSLDTKALDTAPPWQKMLNLITFSGSADLAISFYIATFFLLIVMVLNRSDKSREKIRNISAIMALLTLLSGMVTIIKLYQQEDTVSGIIIAEKAELYEAPLERGAPHESVGEGIKVIIIDDEEMWLKVAVPRGGVGWIKKELVGLI